MEKIEKIPPQHQDAQPGKESAMRPEPEYIRKGYKGSGKLERKSALITGGDSGIGRSVAVHFAREGADVAIAYLSDREHQDAEKTRSLVEAEGRKCLLLQGDLKSPEFCKSIVDRTIEAFGKINVLVNNAAIQFVRESIEEITDAQLELTFANNIFPYFRVSREALKHFSEGDCIINTASITAYEGHPQLLDYSSTKGAIVAFTRSLAAQVAEKGIRVNGVAPGPIWTPLIPATFDDEKTAAHGQNTPLKRPGQPSELGPAYVYLACEDSSYVTGQMIHVNGGSPVNG